MLNTTNLYVPLRIPVLPCGRAIQCIFDKAICTIGYKTIADTAGSENKFRVVFTISAFISGLLVGPMVSGTLIDLIGY